MKNFYQYVKRSWWVSKKSSRLQYTLLLLTDLDRFSKTELKEVHRAIRKEEFPHKVIASSRWRRFFTALRLFWSVRGDTCQQTQNGIVQGLDKGDGKAMVLARAGAPQEIKDVLDESRVDFTLPTQDDLDVKARLKAHHKRFNPPRRDDGLFGRNQFNKDDE